MFQTDIVRTGNFDNLQPWRIYELAEPTVTAAGQTILAGTEFWFEYAVVTLKTRDALVHGSTPEGKHLVFKTHDNSHRRIFVNTWREWRPRGPAVSKPPIAAPPVPAPQPKPAEVSDAVRARANTPEARWLAKQPQFARASEILAGKYSESNWGSACNDADVLRAAAKALELTQPAIASWLADWALTFYHSWMSQATSGGEGTAMMYEIRVELAEMRKLAEGGKQ